MKRIATYSLVFISTLGYSFAQSLQIVNSESAIYSDTSQSLISAYVYVKNISSDPLEVLASRAENNLATNHESYFCWDICYGPAKATADDPLTIDAGATEDAFRGYLKPYGTIGTSYIKYCFFNQDNPADSVCINLSYIISANTGVSSITATMLEAYPNPASDKLTIPYLLTVSQDAAIQLTDLYGRVIYSETLMQSAGKAELNISGLARGMYFYSLITENGSISRRFIKE